MNNNDAVIEFLLNHLLNHLRQQVNSNQCEDLAHEVRSLKNKLRDASALVAELQEDNIKKSEHISHLTGQSSAYRNEALRFQAQVDDMVHEVRSLKNQLRDMSELVDELLGTITLMNGKSSCCKEEAHECYHNWRFVNGKAPAVCVNCGAAKSSECEHEWCVGTFYGTRVSPTYCRKCGATK